jgi:transposase InsO family protein
MSNISYETKFRKRVVEFAAKHDNNSEAGRKYGVSRQRVGVWRSRYDGTLESLLPHSTRPKSHPNQSTTEEIELVLRMWKRHKKYGLDYVYGLLVRKKSFVRERTTMYNILKRNGCLKKKKNPPRKRKNKEYHGATIPGQKLQMDVKYVPKECLPVGHKKLYQWTIIDEATNLRFTQFYDDKANINSVKFAVAARKYFPFELQEIQTDNGTEFTNRFLNTKKLSSFERYTRLAKIRHKLIRPATPRHNGRVERSHRTDDKYFYEQNKFSGLEELRKNGEKWLEKYNNMYMRKFGYLSPMEIYGIYERYHQPLTPKFIAAFNPRQGLAQAA